MNCRLKAAGLPRCKDAGSKKSSQPGGPRGPADCLVEPISVIGVRDLVARGYVIPGGASQRGGVVRLRCFSVARCQTWTILDSGRSPVMPHRDGFWHWYSSFWNRPYPLQRIAVQFEWAYPFGELQQFEWAYPFGELQPKNKK